MSLIQVLTAVFIDCDPLEDLTELHSRSWAKLNDTRALQSARTQITGVFGEGSGNAQAGQVVLLTWVEDYLVSNTSSLLRLKAEKAYRKATTKQGRPVHLNRDEKARLLHDVKEENDRNTLTWRVLGVVDEMVRFGFYHHQQTGIDRRATLQRLLLHMLRDTTGKHTHGTHEQPAHKVKFASLLLMHYAVYVSVWGWVWV